MKTQVCSSNESTVADFGDDHGELKRHTLSPLVEWLYGVTGCRRRRNIAKLFFRVFYALEGGQYKSLTARKLLRRDCGISVGVHSYGEAFNPGSFSPSVVVGKYCSIARDVKVFTQNHPTDSLSTHPYFYEAKFGVIENDVLAPSTTEIGHDVWIGQGAIILPGCKNIGHGAIIGAGAVVTRSVPPFAIVAGNPAKLIKYRFSEDKINQLLAAQWWNEPLETIRRLNDGSGEVLSK